MSTDKRKTPQQDTDNPDDEHLINPVERGALGVMGYQLGNFLSKLLLRIRFEGRENLPRDDSAFVIACNHETFIDGLWVIMALPRAQRERFCSLVAQDLLTDYGFFGRVIVKVGRGVPLNRKGHPVRGLKQAIHQVRNGNILLIHPEGTRSRDGKLGEIQDGAAFIARQARCKIVPVFIDGGYEIFNRYRVWPSWWDAATRRRRPLILRFGKAIDPADFKRVREITAELSRWMNDQYVNKTIPRNLDELPPVMQPAVQRNRRLAGERAKISSDVVNAQYSDAPDEVIDETDNNTEADPDTPS